MKIELEIKDMELIKEKLEYIIENSLDGIVDNDYFYEKISTGVEEMLGKDIGRKIGEEIKKHISKKEFIQEIVEEKVKSFLNCDKE